MSKSRFFLRSGVFWVAFSLCFAAALPGCRHPASGSVLINRVVFYNQSGGPLEEIALVNPQNARMAGCSRLESGTFFEVRFSARPYTEDSPAVLRWAREGQLWRQALPPFRFASGVSYSDAPAAVVITFRPEGMIDSALK